MLSLLGWPWGARVIRAQTLTIRNRDFIDASRESGEKSWRIIVFEIIPNEISLIAASFVNTVLYAIGASVALAFVGLTNLNSWSLGTILYWAQTDSALQSGAWWWFVPAGPRGRAHRHLPGAAQHRPRRARQPPAARVPRHGEDRRAQDLADRPDPGARAAPGEPRSPRIVPPLLLAPLAARRNPAGGDL